MTEATDAEMTYTANTTTNASGHSGKSAPVKKKPKAKLTAKEKKERSVSLVYPGSMFLYT